jgi:uncharacterized protein
MITLSEVTDSTIMSESHTLLSAFLVGLLGAVHCVGMCGGIVGALTFGVQAQGWARWRFQLGYNLGRIASYVVAGVAMGWLGGQIIDLADLHLLRQLVMIVAGLFMIAVGLYLGGWWFGVARVERLGGYLWRYLEPFGRKLLPVRTPFQALVMGAIWGWLPCGLVYSVLIWSLLAGGAVEGGLMMLSFGLGTLPNLLLVGAFATGVAKFFRESWVRQLAGGTIVVMGFWALWQGTI